MLQHLSVRNLAIVEEAAVAFGAGLNIITGETGAGKSVLMGALDLVLGGRADKSAIREGSPEAWVEAVFELADSRAADVLLDAGGLPPCEDGRLLVRRSVAAAGAGRCLVNDAPATVQTLRKLGSLLVDIHGPYDHQSLLNADFQRDLLDAYGHCAPQRAAYAEAWQALKALEARLQDLQGDTADIAVEIDRLQFVVDEISAAGLTDADEEELIQQHAQAANAEQILSLGSSVAGALTDGETSAFDLLANIQIQLAELARILPAAAEWRADVQSAAVQVQELGRAVNDRLSQIDADPGRLQQLEDRMALVQRLKRKYGHTVVGILATLEKHQSRLHDLATRTEQVEKLQQELASATALLKEKASLLSKSRTQAAGKLARAITLELHDLGFLKAGFALDLAACEPGPCGADSVSFGFAPNPGEPMRPLKAIASSGEIARVMLAVKAVLATHDSIPVLVFDEIDANIGGEVGRAVGQKLRRVAENHQVISITHLPQAAVYGHHHFVVSKEVVKGRTKMRIEALDAPQRVDEIARMLGGKGLTSVIENHARELLAAAR
jgi:DNA repair protein RecN (Recombination protein N)